MQPGTSCGLDCMMHLNLHNEMIMGENKSSPLGPRLTARQPPAPPCA
jgi:hypothetical protein